MTTASWFRRGACRPGRLFEPDITSGTLLRDRVCQFSPSSVSASEDAGLDVSGIATGYLPGRCRIVHSNAVTAPWQTVQTAKSA